MAQVQSDGTKAHRLQVELTIFQLAALTKLMSACGLDTKKDLVNNALTFLEWAVEEVQNGNDIASINKERKHYEVLKMPILNHAANFASNNKSRSVTNESTDRVPIVRPSLDLVKN